jgi:hypothetical protein
MRSWATTWRRYLIDLAAIIVKGARLLRRTINSTEYTCFITTARQSAPDRRIGTFSLVFLHLCLFP